jgi:hypothetical protein
MPHKTTALIHALCILFLTGCMGTLKTPKVVSVPPTTVGGYVVPDDEDETVITDTIATSSTVALCEEKGSRRPFPTEEERNQTKQIINDVCRAMGVDTQSCKYFHIVSERESSYRYWVRHRLQGDRDSALAAYVRLSSVYGWEIKWPYKYREEGDTTKMVYSPARSNPNPYYQDVDRWLTGGLGLGGLNIAYHLAKIDPQAPPEILCDPVLNVMVQVTIARIAVSQYGASNWYEVQAIYGGRITSDESGHKVPLVTEKSKKSMHHRCQIHGLNCNAVPRLGKRINLLRMTPEEIYAAADSIRGHSLPEFD